MKRVTASDARRDWFRLLDEVAQGTVVCIERGGRRIVLRCEPIEGEAIAAPDYRAVLEVPDLERADGWTWKWSGMDGDLEPS